MVSGRIPLGEGRWRWVHDGWEADRWLFVAICLGAASCALSVCVGGIVVLVNDPPPVAVWVLAGACAALELWRHHACRDEFDSDDLAVVDAGWEFEPA